MSDLYDGQQRIAAALERMQKVQEYDMLRNWALKLSLYVRDYAPEVQSRMERLAQLQKELWPDA